MFFLSIILILNGFETMNTLNGKFKIFKVNFLYELSEKLPTTTLIDIFPERFYVCENVF